MKTMTIDIEADSSSVEFVLRPGARSGKVVVVLSDEVEILSVTHARPPAPAASKGPASTSKVSADDAASVLKRLRKLNPTTKNAAINSIKAMFNFGPGISDEKATEILESLRKEGALAIDNKGKLKFTTA